MTDYKTDLRLQTLPAEVLHVILCWLDDYSCISISRTCKLFAVYTRRLRLELWKACARAQFEAKFYLLEKRLSSSGGLDYRILAMTGLDSKFSLYVGIPGKPQTFGTVLRFDEYYGPTRVDIDPDPEPPLSKRANATCERRGWHPVQWIIRKHRPTFIMLPLCRGEIIVPLEKLTDAQKTALVRDILLCFPQGSFWGIWAMWKRIDENKAEFPIPIPPAPEQSDRRLWRRVFRILYRNR